VPATEKENDVAVSLAAPFQCCVCHSHQRLSAPLALHCISVCETLTIAEATTLLCSVCISITIV